MTERSAEGGFTLIEVMISLALFALISLAGIALIDSIVRVEERTSGRLERLGQLQRAMFLLTRDLEQATSGSLEQVDGGIRFERQPASIYEAGQPISYALRGDSLMRVVGGGTEQLLIGGVSSADWSFFFPEQGWLGTLPVEPPAAQAPQAPQAPPARPGAVAVDILLDEAAPPSGVLRRVVELPAAPPAPAAPPVSPETIRAQR